MDIVVYSVIAGILILFSFINALKAKKNPLSKEVCDYVRTIGILFALKALFVGVVSPVPSLIFYSLIEYFHVILMIYFMRFTVVLCKDDIPHSFRIAVRVLILLDLISFVINGFTGHLFTLNIVNGVVETNIKPLYLSHALVMAFICIYIVAVLLKKMSKCHYIHWVRYLMNFICVIWLLARDTFYSLHHNHGYYSEVGYIIGAGLLIFFVVLFRPKLIRIYEYSEAYDSLSQHLFLFDNVGECVLVNSSAKEFFGIDENNLEKAEAVISRLLARPICEDEMEYVQVCDYVRYGVEYHLRLNYKKILHRGKFAGSLYGFTDITAETKELEEQTRLARYDSFTMIYDRNWLCASIEKELAENPDTEYYVIGSDIRDFKVFNDVFGKEAGDMVILHIAEVLKQLHKEGHISMFGRIYADRFGMLVKKTSFREENIVDKFLSIDHPFKEENYHLNIHFGVYPTSMETGLPVKAMFDRAYVALDSIKNEVNIRTYHYNEIMRDEKIWEQTISQNIERAIKEGQLRIVVQPQVNREEKVIGGEALVRWRHPENGEISPGEFIPILEKTGLVTSADLHVWEESCKLLRRWKDMGYENYYISVNISATDFIFADIYTIFTKLVEKHGVSPRNLKLEITETAMMTDVLERIVLIKRLEEYGFSVELDDFGSGYSSLNMLKEIPVDVIKMDMKFLYNYEEKSTSNSKKIIGHIIQMSKDLNMEIVAEGVETKEQLAFLREMGCDTFQGYYFSKPLEVVDFEDRQGIA